jgi:large subunit ribosomal protein L29
MASKNVTRADDLRNQSAEELTQFVRTKEEELLKLKFQHATGQLENTARKKVVRRELARARTIMTQKAKAQG